jgi:hypothetical protein
MGFRRRVAASFSFLPRTANRCSQYVSNKASVRHRKSEAFAVDPVGTTATQFFDWPSGFYSDAHAWERVHLRQT